MTDLDDIDRAILRALSADAGDSAGALGRRFGLSQPAAWRRVRRLEQAGILAGRRVVVDRAALGFGVTVFAFVSLKSQADADLRAFQAIMEALPMVRECHMLTGETDFLIKVVAQDWDAYEKFLTTQLTAAPNVSNVKSALTIRTTKNQPGVPIEAKRTPK